MTKKCCWVELKWLTKMSKTKSWWLLNALRGVTKETFVGNVCQVGIQRSERARQKKWIYRLKTGIADAFVWRNIEHFPSREIGTCTNRMLPGAADWRYSNGKVRLPGKSTCSKPTIRSNIWITMSREREIERSKKTVLCFTAASEKRALFEKRRFWLIRNGTVMRRTFFRERQNARWQTVSDERIRVW